MNESPDEARREMDRVLANRLADQRATTCRVIVRRLREISVLPHTAMTAWEVTNFAKAVLATLEEPD
jgi:hypothetical protein